MRASSVPMRLRHPRSLPNLRLCAQENSDDCRISGCERSFVYHAYFYSTLTHSGYCSNGVQRYHRFAAGRVRSERFRTSAARSLHPTAAQLGLWPSAGPAVSVCGPAPAGSARCLALVRTDIKGMLRPATPSGYGPSDLQTAYNLTSYSSQNGGGQTVAIVDAYDDPNAEADLGVYRSQYGLSACTTANGCFSKVKQGSTANAGWAEEESLDVDMVSAICPTVTSSWSKRPRQRPAV